MDELIENDMTLIEQFETLLRSQVNRGIYVWGGNGEDLCKMKDPEAWIRDKETSETNAERAIKLYRRRKAAGLKEIRAFDCSGLVYWALKTLGLIAHDESSRGLYKLCKPIEEKELKPGDLVFHDDGTQIVHVGVWVTGGYQIESMGRDVGVVKSKRKAGYWNRFGRYPKLQEDPQPKPPKKTVYVKGGSVRVREGDNVSTKQLGTAHRGDTFPLLGTSEATGWYRIPYGAGEGYITNNARYTEVVDDG